MDAYHSVSFFTDIVGKRSTLCFFHDVSDWTWLSGFICVTSRQQIVLIKRDEHIEINKETSMPAASMAVIAGNLYLIFIEENGTICNINNSALIF